MNNRYKLFLHVCICALATVLFSADDPLAGPHTVDDNTVLLMHFDDDLTNEGTSGDGTAHGTVTYVAGKFGNAAYINNGAVVDSVIAATDTTAADTVWKNGFMSWISVEDHDDLDFGDGDDFTVEGWFKFADTSSYSWTGASSIVSKADTTGKLNYRVAAHKNASLSWDMFGGDPGLEDPRAPRRGAIMGESHSPNDGWTHARPNVTIDFPATTGLASVTGGWLKFIYSRDADERMVSFVVFDENGNQLTGYNAWNGDLDNWNTHRAYDNLTTSSLQLILGRKDTTAADYLDGHIDEIRISNIVRNYDIRPAVAMHEEDKEGHVQSFKYDMGYDNFDHTADATLKVRAWVFGATDQVASVVLKHRSVTDETSGIKVAHDDASFTDLAFAQVAGTPDWTATIGSGTFNLGDYIEYYWVATSTTGKVTVAGVCADSTYARVGWWDPMSKLLHIDFEEEEAPYADASDYGHVINWEGNWVSSDDDPANGEFSGHMQDGAFAKAHLKTPLLRSAHFTVTHWSKGDVYQDNSYYVGYYPWAGMWYRDNYALIMRAGGDKVGSDAYMTSLYPGEMPWQHGTTQIDNVPVETWGHWLQAMDKDSLVVQVNDEDDVPVTRMVLYADGFSVGHHDDGYGIFRAVTPSRGVWRIGPQSNGAWADARYWLGRKDDIEIWNYYHLPGNFANAPALAVDDNKVVALEYQLSDNYPNPFNPVTNIDFQIGRSEFVTLEVYDVVGRLVKTLAARTINPGQHTISWDGTNTQGELVSTGLYFYRINTPNFNKQKKMMFIK